MLLSVTRRPVGGEGRRWRPLLQAGMFTFDKSVATALFLSSGGKSILGEEVTKKALCSPKPAGPLFSLCSSERDASRRGGRGKMVPAPPGSLDTQAGASAGALGIHGKGCCSWGRVFAQTGHGALEGIDFLWNMVPWQ